MSAHDSPALDGRARLNVALYVLTVLALCAALAFGVLALRAWQDRPDGGGPGSTGAPSDVDGDVYHDVLEAATAEATAFINIDYRTMDESIDAVRAGATGSFRRQFDRSVSSLREVLTGNRSVMEGEVLSAGVVAADHDSATVLVATKGTVMNKLTEGEKQERNLRLQIELALTDDEWLVSDLQFVG